MTFKQLVKTSFALGVGFNLASLIFSFIGVLFVVFGLYLLRKKKDEQISNSTYMFGIGFLVIGVVFLGGYGIGLISDNLDF